MSWKALPLCIALGIVPAACSRGDKKDKHRSATEPGRKAVTITVKSSAFDGGKPIPKKHAYKGEGENVSPPLSWSGVPATAKTLAIICDDPDAPSPKRPREKPWVHWVVYNIPGDKTSLAESDHGGGVLGKTDFGEKAYGGPMPPPGSGTHRYFFKIYALDTRLDLKAGATKDELLKAMEGHIVAKGELHGTYERK